jgi:hypothetical protein
MQTLEQQLYAAQVEIARLNAVIKKMKQAAKGDGFKPLFPGQRKGY